jgi:lipopolysaccharide biosynthesis protein
LVFSSKVFNSKVFEDFIKDVKKENSKDAVIKNYELTVTRLLEKNGFTCASYCGEYPDEMGGLHVRLWEKLIKEDKTPFIKTSVPRFKNIKIVSSLSWKRILKKHTNYNVNLIRKDLKRNRKKSDVFKEVLLTSKLVRRKIIRINFSKRKIHILGIDGADFPVIIKSKIKNLTIKKRGRTNPHTIKFLGKNPEMYN